VTGKGREAKLGVAGRGLWDDLASDGHLTAVEATILLEACRTVDALERLDGILRGRDRVWLQVEMPETGDELVLVVDKALAERRQQQITLKSLLAEFRQAASRRAPAEKPRPETRGGGGLADLTARIEARRNSTAG
jgi:hypothetical protein